MDKKLTIEEIKAYSLNILKDIKRVCTELNLRYFLDSGTLLGAIRHNGFIPWDDDIDIVMPRPDYEIFCKSYNKISNNNYYVSSLYTSRNYPFSFAKVYDRRTKKIERGVYLFDQGLSVDIFPLDGYPSDITGHYKKLVNNFNKYAAAVAHAFSKYEKFSRVLHNLNTLCCRLYLAHKRAIDVQKFAKSIDYEKADYVGCNSIMYYHQENCRAIKKMCYEPMLKQFEDDMFVVPVGYKDILSMNYGADYMIPPPAELRKSTHEIEIYKIK